MKRPPRFEGWAIAGFLFLGCAALYQIGFRPATFAELLQTGPAFERYTRPDLSVLPRMGGLIWETIVMAIWGTVVALLFAIPAAPIAARNLTRHPIAYRLMRETLSFFRALPDALLALILIQGLGLGPMAGALALGLHTAGYLGKVLAETMERVPRGVYEGLNACGATTFQVIRFGAWPTIEREVIGNTLYLLDRNLRVATTLGIVGAGGIGAELVGSLRTFQHARAAAVLLVIVALVLATDALSGWLRRKL